MKSNLLFESNVGALRFSRRALLGGTGAAGLGWLVGCATSPALPAAPPAGRSFLVSGGTVVSVDPAIGELPEGHVLVREGRIESVTAQRPATDLPVIDARGMIVMPGMIETHWHMWGAVARNMAGDTPDSGYFPYSRVLGSLFSPEDNARGVRLALAEAIHSGLTTVHNWSHNLLTPAHADAELAAHREAGSRARFAYGYSRNTKNNETLPIGDVERVYRQFFAPDVRLRDSVLTLGIASRGPEYNTADICRREWESARRLGLAVTTHIGITPPKAPKQPPDGIAILRENGLLGPDTLLVHATNNTKAQFELLARTRTPVSLSPYTELRTGFGITPINEMLLAGMQLSLSVDTTLLSGNADMFAIMKMLENIGNGGAYNEFKLSARKVLELATIEGARSLLLQEQIGSLTPGKRADLLLLRTDGLNMAPTTDPVRMIVQSAQPSDVDTVMVDGRILKWQGRLTTLDPARVVADARDTISRVRRTLAEPAADR